MKNPFKILRGNNELDPVELEKAINRLYDAADDNKLVKPKSAMAASQVLWASEVITGINCTFKSTSMGKANAKVTWIPNEKFIRYDCECRVTESQTSQTYTMTREAASPTATFENLPTGYKIQVKVRGLTQGGARGIWSQPVSFDVYVESEKLMPPTGLTVTKYWKWCLAKVDRITRSEDKNFKCFEWHVGLSEDFTPDEDYERDNLFLNNSFEGNDGTEVSDWTVTGLTNTYDATKKKGTNPKEVASAKLVISSPTTQHISQTLTVDPNGTYIISGFFRATTAQVNGKVWVADFTGTGGTPGLDSPWNTDNIVKTAILGNWRAFYLRIKVNQYTTGLTVYFGANEAGTINYDRVTIKKINSTFIKRSHGNSIIFHLDKDPSTTEYVRVRKINHDGSVSDYCEGVSQYDSETGSADQEAPGIPQNLEYVSTEHTGWKWLRRADVLLRVDITGLVVDDFKGLQIAWRRQGKNLWFSRRVHLDDLYTYTGASPNQYRFEVENLGVGKTYEFRCRSYDKSNNESAWSNTLTQLIGADTTTLPDPILNTDFIIDGEEIDGDAYWRAGEKKFWFTQAYIDNYGVSKIELRAKKSVKLLWKFFHIQQVEDCFTENYYSVPTYSFYFDRLFQNTSYDCQVRCTTYWGKKTNWVNCSFSIDKENPIDLSGVTIDCGVFPRSRGLRFFRNWYIWFQFDLTGVPGLSHRFELKTARQVTGFFGVNRWLKTSHWIGYNAETGELVDIVHPVWHKPVTDLVGATSGFKYNIRAWYNARPGVPKFASWTDPSAWGDVPIKRAPDEEAVTIPTPSWEQIWWRYISVTPCELTWNYPENFAHFVIHATTSDSTYEEGWNSRSRIGFYHRWDRKPHTYFVPLAVYNSNLASGAGKKQFGVQLTNIKIWVVPVLWKYPNDGDTTGTPEPQSALIAGSQVWNAGTEDDTDPFRLDMAITQRSVAAFGGDQVYTACARLAEDISVSETSIRIERLSGESCPFTQYDLISFGSQGTKFGVAGQDNFNHDSHKEVMRITSIVTGIFAYTLNVIRDWNNKLTTNETAKAGGTIVKVGKGLSSQTFRFTWYDSLNACFKITDVTCNAGETDITQKLVAKYGHTAEAALFIGGSFRTSGMTGASSGSGVIMDNSGIRGYNGSVNTFAIGTDGKAWFKSAGGNQWDGGNINNPGIYNPTFSGGYGSGSDISIMGWTQSCQWVPIANNIVRWNAGKINFPNLAGGTTYNISQGQTNVLSGSLLTTGMAYIFFDPSYSTTAYGVIYGSNNASQAVGNGRVIVGVCKVGSTTASPEFTVFGGGGGIQTLITANNIAANCITANEILANTITANQLSTVLTFTQELILSTNGKLRTSGATDFLNGVGLWMGYDGTYSPNGYKFRIGSGTKFLAWDGTNLYLNGMRIDGATLSHGNSMILGTAAEQYASTSGSDQWLIFRPSQDNNARYLYLGMSDRRWRGCFVYVGTASGFRVMATDSTSSTQGSIFCEFGGTTYRLDRQTLGGAVWTAV